MRIKKVLAVGLAATMMMGSSMVALAAEESTATATGGGTGTLEGVVDTDVFNVVLPTVSETTFNYIADPQGLIAKTDQAHYDGKTFGEGTIFFANAAEDKENDYSSSSDKLVAVNKSSKPLKLTVTASASVGSSGKDARLAASETLSESDAEVYLALVDSEDVTTVLTGVGQNIEQVLGASPEGAYEYVYEESAYKYQLKSDVSAYKFAEYSVYITGAASENGWEAATTVPTISVVWAAELAGTEDEVTVETPAQTPAAPAAYVSATKVTSASPSITLSAPQDVTVSSVVLTKKDSSTVTWAADNQYKIEGSTFTVIIDAILTNQVGASFKITFSDGHEEVISIAAE